MPVLMIYLTILFEIESRRLKSRKISLVPRNSFGDSCTQPKG